MPAVVRAGAERAEVTAEFALERLPDVRSGSRTARSRAIPAGCCCAGSWSGAAARARS